MLNQIILFRPSFNDGSLEEATIAAKYFTIKMQRNACYKNLVIGRYSVLPYYRELARDLDLNESKLINNYDEHQYIANMEWLQDIEDTPKTWTDDNFYQAPEDQYVVKGRTNSVKAKWNTLMFAKDKRRALDIAGELCSDSLIGPQTIVYRKYVPLKTYEVGINGLPFTHEFRLFFYKNKLLCYGYYWSVAEKTDIDIGEDGLNFAQSIADNITTNNRTNFYVLDIAQDINDKWWLIEMNDGQMSGLSMCDPHKLYGNLRKALNEYS